MTKSGKQFMNIRKKLNGIMVKREEMKMKQGDEVTASEGKRGENADIK